jgi:hypothetical protein
MEVQGKNVQEKNVADEIIGNIEADAASATPEAQEKAKAGEVKSVVSAELPAQQKDRVCPPVLSHGLSTFALRSD